MRKIDVVEREAVKEAIGFFNLHHIAYGETKSLLDVINEIPTVDAVEVVHGRWVHKGAWHIECSECKHILAHIGEAKNYCPNCGANMDGGNEDG